MNNERAFQTKIVEKRTKMSENKHIHLNKKINKTSTKRGKKAKHFLSLTTPYENHTEPSCYFNIPTPKSERKITMTEALKDLPKDKRHMQWCKLRKYYIQAEEREIASLKEKKTFTPQTEIPKGRKTIPLRWVYAVKPDEDNPDFVGSFKARLVVKGFYQKYGIDYHETYSPTLRPESLRTILAICASKRIKNVKQKDFRTAFLNGKMDTVLFVKLPPGYEKDFGECPGLLLNGSLYGSKQAQRIWNKLLNDTILDFSPHIKRSVSDECIYIYDYKDTYIIIGAFGRFSVWLNKQRNNREFFELSRFKIRHARNEKIELVFEVTHHN